MLKLKSLSCLQVTDETLELVAKLSKLQALRTGGTRISAAGIGYLEGATALTSLHLQVWACLKVLLLCS